MSELRGVGCQMPITVGCFALGALSLVGIPPFAGFFSKWYLANGALASQTPVFGWLGPVVLLLSALLTAGYLLPIMIQGFFPGKDFDESELKKRKLVGKEPSACMLVPVVILGIASILLGCFPGSLITMLEQIAVSVL